MEPKLVDEIMSNFVSVNIKKILNVVDIRALTGGARDGVSTTVTCLACQALVAIIFNKWIPIKAIASAVVGICSSLGLPNVSPDVCAGYVELFKDPLDYIRHNTQLKQTEVCGILLGVQCFIGPSANLYWTLKLNKLNKNRVKLRPKLNKQNISYRILHLSDIHLDTKYVPLTDPNCGTPYCCRPSANESANQSPVPGAGDWGSYHCDIPMKLLENLFETIDWSQIDWVYWTGDLTPHNSWQDTRAEVIASSKIISSYFKTYSKTKVLYAFGNHAGIPVGTFPPQDIKNNLSISWLYNESADEFSQWLTNNAFISFKNNGYYVINDLDIQPGLRIIVLNTNYCARLNIWTLYRSIDPADQLKWLIQQLALAEKASDKVHIIGHIPPDNRECTQAWLYNYMAIVERYNKTIVAQFYGHTHYDEFRVLYSNSDCNQPIGFEILSPSVTPYESDLDLNPAYRLINCSQNGLIEDIETYTFNLSEANAKPGNKPEWYLEYSMASAYSLQLNTFGFDQLIRNIIRDNYYLQLFYSYYVRQELDSNGTYCNSDCKLKVENDTRICNAFQSIPKSILTIG